MAKKWRKNTEKNKKNGDDPIEKEARSQTEKAWKEEKKKKMVIMSEGTNNVHEATPDEDSSFFRTESFRLSLGKNVLNKGSEFRAKVIMQPKRAKSVGAHIQSKHKYYQSQSESLNIVRGQSLDNGLEENKTKKIPMSSHQVGLIQTSQEWEALQFEEKNKNKEKRKKKELNHHRQTSSFKISTKGKKVKFQESLGPGTQSFMHRYR